MQSENSISVGEDTQATELLFTHIYLVVTQDANTQKWAGKKRKKKKEEDKKKTKQNKKKKPTQHQKTPQN